MKKSYKILSIQLKEAASIGPQRVPEDFIGNNEDGRRVFFDQDARFIRVESIGTEFYELVPLSNVRVINIVKPD